MGNEQRSQGLVVNGQEQIVGGIWPRWEGRETVRMDLQDGYFAQEIPKPVTLNLMLSVQMGTVYWHVAVKGKAIPEN